MQEKKEEDLQQALNKVFEVGIDEVGRGAIFGPVFAAAVVFVIAAIALSRTAAPGFDWLLDRLKAPGAVVVASFVILVLCCFVATAIGLEAALGAFAAGLILSSS